jgi:hypothetical protein
MAAAKLGQGRSILDPALVAGFSPSPAQPRLGVKPALLAVCQCVRVRMGCFL